MELFYKSFIESLNFLYCLVVRQLNSAEKKTDACYCQSGFLHDGCVVVAGTSEFLPPFPGQLHTPLLSALLYTSARFTYLLDIVNSVNINICKYFLEFLICKYIIIKYN